MERRKIKKFKGVYLMNRIIQNYMESFLSFQQIVENKLNI